MILEGVRKERTSAQVEHQVVPDGTDWSPAPVRPAYPLDGLLAILVTDLQGFTALVEQLGDHAGRALIQGHNRLLRQSIQRHGGGEVTHTGDGVIAAFRAVTAALLCALDVQHQLRSASLDATPAPLRVRIGVHAGEPLPEDGRLFGSCVNTAVRICSWARADQVLVTDVVRQLAQGHRFAFSGSTLVKLKGFEGEARVFELSAAQ